MSDFSKVEAAAIRFLCERYETGKNPVMWKEFVAGMSAVSSDHQLLARVQGHIRHNDLIARGKIEPGSRVLLPWRRSGEAGWDCVVLAGIRNAASKLPPDPPPPVGEANPSTTFPTANDSPSNESAEKGMLRLLREHGDIVLEWDSPIIAEKLSKHDSTIRKTRLWKVTWPEERRLRKIQVVTKAKRADRKTELHA